MLVPFVEAQQQDADKQAAYYSMSGTITGIPVAVNSFPMEPKRASVRTRKPVASGNVARLIKQLRSPETIDRIYAAFDLGELGSSAAPAVPSLVAGLNDDSKWMRRASAKALGKIGLPACSATPALRRSLGDRDKYVRDSTTNALRRLDRVCSVTSARGRAITR